MRIYTTKQGDMFDSIAHSQLGHDVYADMIVGLNRQYHDVYIFPAGIELVLPEIAPEPDAGLPPWKQV